MWFLLNVGLFLFAMTGNSVLTNCIEKGANNMQKPAQENPALQERYDVEWKDRNPGDKLAMVVKRRAFSQATNVKETSRNAIRKSWKKEESELEVKRDSDYIESVSNVVERAAQFDDKYVFLLRNSRILKAVNKPQLRYQQRQGNASRETATQGLAMRTGTKQKTVRRTEGAVALNFETKNNLTGPTRPRERRNLNSVPKPAPTCDDSEFSCQNRCANPASFSLLHTALCYCDIECILFEDCCADFAKFCFKKNETAYMVLRNASKLLNRTQQEWGKWKCFRYPEDNTMDQKGTYGVWMIHTCPSTWQGDSVMSEKCKTPFKPSKWTDENTITDTLPVYTVDGKVYHNRYCALCNGEEENSTRPYDVTYNCAYWPPKNVKDKIAYLVAHGAIKSISWRPPSNSPRRHCFELEDSCLKFLSLDDKFQCEFGTSGIVTTMTTHSRFMNYRNTFCAACDETECGPAQHDKPVHKARHPTILSFSLTFNFRESMINPVSYSKSECPLFGTYDPYLEVCGEPFDPPTLSVFYQVVIELRLSNKNSSIELAKLLPMVFHEALTAQLNLGSWNISDFYADSLNYGEHTLRFQAKRMGHTSRDRLEIEESGVFSMNFDRLLLFSGTWNLTINGTVFSVVKVTKQVLTCPGLRYYNGTEYTPLNEPEYAVFINESREVIPAKDYYRNGTGATIVVCGNIPACSNVYIPFEDNELTIFPNKSVYINATKEVLNQSFYFRDHLKTWICKDLQVKKINVQHHPVPYLTFVCMVLSIVALVFFLITYSLFSELRTVPGINLMNLSSSILLAQMLWIIGIKLTQFPTCCTAVAVLLHYFFLASLSWNAIIAYDAWKAFSDNSYDASRKEARTKKLVTIRYMAFSWIPAFLFVVTCFALDKFKVVSIGYGSDQACWMTEKSAILYFFVFPVASILILNITLYILIVKSIRAVGQQVQTATQGTRNKRHFSVYVRIGAVMGFTWLVGFVAVYFPPLWYAYDILNCLQGVYITFSFALNARVRNMYSQMLNK